MSKGTVVIVGPGKGFGELLISSLLHDGYNVVTMSQTKKIYDTSAKVQQIICDLSKNVSVSKACERLKNLNDLKCIIYAAKSPKIVTAIDDVSALNKEMTINFISCVQIYSELKDALLHNKGCYICIGGNFATEPSVNHIGLSISKAAMRNFAQMYSYANPPIKLMTVEGAITTSMAIEVVSKLREIIKEDVN